MLLNYFCGPSIIYFSFVLIHVIMSTYHNKTNAAILQLLIGILITLLLQLLCMRGMSVISCIYTFYFLYIHDGYFILCIWYRTRRKYEKTCTTINNVFKEKL